ncbi:MAG: beta-ketoacyl-ACP synthase II [Planctomycetaceae bacterium]|jgi:3-oxoacyl-[acyl-carrier-protein] synthase II|nr:beta-ketoacyl-ACP synthase II [Planctomycetaceae bacterium]
MRRVVITGLGIVSPIGIGLQEFWKNVKAGVCGIGTITRFDASAFPCRIAGEVKNNNGKNYCGEDFLDRRILQRTALFSQFAMIAAQEAWNDAGFGAADGQSMLPAPERCGVLLGNGIGGLEIDDESHRKLYEKGNSKIPAMTIPKMISNEAAGNVSMMLGIKGSAHALVTACASGTDAVGFALDRIRCGRADVMLTGGTESTITDYGIGGFCQLKALSTGFNDTPQKACRPFDKGRDGFVMGEGAGIVILEEQEHARRRGAKIYAELAGFGASADAYHLTAPSPGGEGGARALQLALQDAGLKPEDVDYINAHGTSTPTNDPVETKAIKNAFGDYAYKLAVSSTKSMTGHTLGAAGGIETVITALAVQDGFFPATLNLDDPDPECDLDYVPHKGRTGVIRAALSMSLGFGGHNSVVAVKKSEP